MVDVHTTSIALSPKGQVATARCSCGWEEKFRSRVGSETAEVSALAAADLHVVENDDLIGSGGGRDEHTYQLRRGFGGSVIASCACGWSTKFFGAYRGPASTEFAVENADRHVSWALKPEHAPGHGPSSSPESGIPDSSVTASRIDERNAGTFGSGFAKTVLAVCVLVMAWVILSTTRGDEDEPEGPADKYFEVETQEPAENSPPPSPNRFDKTAAFCAEQADSTWDLWRAQEISETDFELMMAEIELICPGYS